MFIAHLPSGYLLSKFLDRTIKSNGVSWKWLLGIVLFGSIAPDLDLFYFYFIDGRQHPHHAYWSHIPFYWISIYFLVAGFALLFNQKKLLYLSSVLFCSILLHLFLDTITGGILWYYPFAYEYVTLVEVLPKYGWWVMNFILHWTFALELVFVFTSFLVFFHSHRQTRSVMIIPDKTQTDG